MHVCNKGQMINVCINFDGRVLGTYNDYYIN